MQNVIGAEFGLADFLQLMEVAVIADADEDVVGAKAERSRKARIGMLLPVSCGGLPCMK
jgi:hypothetical protein